MSKEITINNPNQASDVARQQVNKLCSGSVGRSFLGPNGGLIAKYTVRSLVNLASQLLSQDVRRAFTDDAVDHTTLVVERGGMDLMSAYLSHGPGAAMVQTQSWSELIDSALVKDSNDFDDLLAGKSSFAPKDADVFKTLKDLLMTPRVAASSVSCVSSDAGVSHQVAKSFLPFTIALKEWSKKNWARVRSKKYFAYPAYPGYEKGGSNG